MRLLHRYLALAICFAVTGTVAEARPARHGRHHKVSKKAKHRAKVAPRVDHDVATDEDLGDDEDRRDEESGERSDDESRFEDENLSEDEVADEEAEIPRYSRSRKSARAREKARRKNARAVRAREESESESDDRVAFATPDGPDFEIRDEVERDRDTRVKLREASAARAKDWHVAIGPYLWASSVDANVSLGSASVAAGVDFIEMQRHARYGAEVLAEAHYRRFSISGDLMYGVVSVNGQREVGPLMVTLDGTASSLLVDGAAGYTLAGDDHSLLSLEARGGVRYQRTAVAGSVDVGGNMVAPPDSVDAGGDAIAGARVFLRPFSRLSLSSAVDIGVYGVSNSTWSASADASLRVTSHVLLSLGYRTLTIDRAQVAVTMHGPRAAVQLLF